jgi:hypothetical protein
MLLIIALLSCTSLLIVIAESVFAMPDLRPATSSLRAS